jgi:hypothetical protein
LTADILTNISQTDEGKRLISFWPGAQRTLLAPTNTAVNVYTNQSALWQDNFAAMLTMAYHSLADLVLDWPDNGTHEVVQSHLSTYMLPDDK